MRHKTIDQIHSISGPSLGHMLAHHSLALTSSTNNVDVSNELSIYRKYYGRIVLLHSVYGITQHFSYLQLCDTFVCIYKRAKVPLSISDAYSIHTHRMSNTPLTITHTHVTHDTTRLLIIQNISNLCKCPQLNEAMHCKFSFYIAITLLACLVPITFGLVPISS